MTALEQQWAELYARGVVPREVALAVDYSLGTSDVWGKKLLSDAITRWAKAAGLRIESHVEWQARIQVRRAGTVAA